MAPGLVVLDAEVEDLSELAEQVSRRLVEEEMLDTRDKKQFIDTLLMSHR